MSDMHEPLTPDTAKRLIRHILDAGTLSYSRHSMDEMLADGLTTLDCVNVLRAGFVQPAEREHGGWRYRVQTARIVVIVAFRSAVHLVVVTAWRLRR
jgi:hypothetical protein